MSIDCRTRLHSEFHELPRDEVFDALLPEAIEAHGELAARGVRYNALAPLRFLVGDRGVTLRERDGTLRLDERESADDTVVRLDATALSELVQDRRTTMGLAMNSLAKLQQGEFASWIGWEPALRALLDGRPVHEAGAISITDRNGGPLDLRRSFHLEDDPEEISHFLHQAGFLRIRNVFREDEMAAVSADLDAALERATPEDGASWWAETSDGTRLPVRVLWFHEQSVALTALLQDERLQWLTRLTGDGHGGPRGTMGAEGLIKPLDIASGLSDLPWHKDCGQGMHSLMCCGLTVGISVTGADSRCGALGVVPGSHRANVQTAGLDPSLDIAPIQLETKTGDITVHCSDTLHCAHRPLDRTRKVVYTGLRLPPKPGDKLPVVEKGAERAARARLTNVQDRIAAAGSKHR